MDYAVGSVAALISGNVTPNRPRLIRRALTPTKHQPSPNVTPKSEFVDDRSIFLSPSLQKKKAIVKKSPKRIFENPDLDVTNDGEGSTLLSPKADKVKKHLKEELDANEKNNMSPKSPKSPRKGKLDKSMESKTPKKKFKISENYDDQATQVQNVNESTPKKKKIKRSLVQPVEEEKENLTEQAKETSVESNKTSMQKRKSQNVEETRVTATTENKEKNESTPKKKKKNSVSQESETKVEITKPEDNIKKQQLSKKKKKRNKKGKSKAESQNIEATVSADNENQETEPIKQQTSSKKKNKKVKGQVNPNAITNKDSDSEHESDDEIQSENEETNNEILKTEAAESSDDEEEKEDDKKQKKLEQEQGTEESRKEEIMRTLFIGNVPFSKKCKKEIKKIFDKYGVIETVRIRNVPVKDARVTPKLAVIKNELHPERTTVNIYVRFQKASSVAAALAENNTVLNDHHLRVSRSDTAGNEHDPNKSVFVGNLPFALEDDALRAKFASCGEIESVRIIRDNKTNAGKGFGYVNFASKDGVELALAISEEDLTIKNRILRVKRCTFASQKGPKQNPRSPGYQGNQRSSANRSQGMKRRGQEGRNQGNFGRSQGNFNRNQESGRNQGSFGRNQGSFGRNQDTGRNQGNFGRSQGNFGRSQGNFGRSQGDFGRNQGFGGPPANEDKSLGQDGAHRRILKKRHNEEPVGGPPNQRPDINQPREKKPRKEFVGMTAEKKKKQKFNKGDKKKRVLSEILTKHNSDK